jgi:hypothetical protein
MDERRQADEIEAEDLELREDDAEGVKGGSKNEVSIESIELAHEASPQLKPARGGWDGNHTHTLIEL